MNLVSSPLTFFFFVDPSGLPRFLLTGTVFSSVFSSGVGVSISTQQYQLQLQKYTTPAVDKCSG